MLLQIISKVLLMVTKMIAAIATKLKLVDKNEYNLKALNLDLDIKKTKK